MDVFSDTGANDKKIGENIYQNDDDLIAQELADLGSEDTASIGAAKNSELSQDPIQENTESDAATGTENAENKGLFKQYVLDSRLMTGATRNYLPHDGSLCRRWGNT